MPTIVVGRYSFAWPIYWRGAPFDAESSGPRAKGTISVLFTFGLIFSILFTETYASLTKPSRREPQK